MSLLSDVESLNGTTWQPGALPPMPYPVYEHCIVKLNDSAFISIGGLNYTYGTTGKSTNR